MWHWRDPDTVLIMSIKHAWRQRTLLSFHCCKWLFTTPLPQICHSFHTSPKLAWCASCANGLSCPYHRHFSLEDKRVPNYPITHISCAAHAAFLTAATIMDSRISTSLSGSFRICFDELKRPDASSVEKHLFSSVGILGSKANFYLCKEAPWSFLINV